MESLCILSQKSSSFTPFRVGETSSNVKHLHRTLRLYRISTVPIDHRHTFGRLTIDTRIHYKKGAKANSAQERKKRKSIKDRERTEGEAAGEEEEADWEKAGKEKREDAYQNDSY